MMTLACTCMELEEEKILKEEKTDAAHLWVCPIAKKTNYKRHINCI